MDIYSFMRNLKIRMFLEFVQIPKIHEIYKYTTSVYKIYKYIIHINVIYILQYIQIYKIPYNIFIYSTYILSIVYIKICNPIKIHKPNREPIKNLPPSIIINHRRKEKLSIPYNCHSPIRTSNFVIACTLLSGKISLHIFRSICLE